MKARSGLLWTIWGVSAVALTYWLAGRLQGEERGIFLPGQSTAGHYQIELACDACHTKPFTAAEDFQPACEGCHGRELEDARDTHPQSKFTDPRNADRVALLDARYCVACHIEHRPEVTHAMGLTIPEDFCGLCHQDIAEERPSHAGMEFSSCASAGCHNFHDNRSIYEDFLLRHADDPELEDDRELPQRNFAGIASFLESYPKDRFPLVPLTVALADAPPDVLARSSSDGSNTGVTAANGDVAGGSTRGHAGSSYADRQTITDEWLASAHARNGVNCTACHASETSGWVERPEMSTCGTCHTNEVAGFVSGRHGMRLNAEALGRRFEPLAVADARAELKEDPLAAAVTCDTCHPAHDYDTRFAASSACLACHDDSHSRAYPDSPHARIDEVTCATCHMPRTSVSYQFGAFSHVLVDHNQNANLRPNEKMIRSVCLECHGLGFSIDALADEDLIERNFAGRPRAHVESIDLALERRRQIDEARARDRQEAARSDD